MAKKAAKARKATRSRTSGPRPEPKFVKTGELLDVIDGLLSELREAQKGETNWTWIEGKKVAAAEFALGTTRKLFKCNPTQSFPRP